MNCYGLTYGFTANKETWVIPKIHPTGTNSICNILRHNILPNIVYARQIHIIVLLHSNVTAGVVNQSLYAAVS